MSVPAATAPRSWRASTLDRLAATRIAIDWKLALYAVVLFAAFALRFWDLGARALHHDESIHAQWSWKLLQGDYRHSPIFHGPLYYHIQGLTFFLLGGASDYTARVSAALFGTALVAMPLLLRRQLGPLGTFAAVAFIALSPTLVYFSRFFREDIYMAVFTLAMVIGMWRYLEDGRQRWLALIVAGFVGNVLVKEGAFLAFATFLVYLDLHLAHDLARRMARARDLDTPWRRAALTFFLAPYAWVIAAPWPLIGGLRRRLDFGNDLPRAGDLLVLLGTFCVPLLTPVGRTLLLEPLGIVEKDRLSWELRFQSGNIAASDALLLAGLFAITTSGAAFVGLQWRPRFWAIAFLLGAAVYLTFMTFFWTNPSGLVSGPWGSLDYWYGQHDDYRADQPWFYYYLLMGAYEFLPLALILGGAWWSLVRGTPFSRFLWAWLVGMWLALSWGGEKMPWLNTHLALPAALLAAWTVQRAWQAWRDHPPLRSLAPTLISIAAIAAGTLALVAFLPGGGAALLLRLFLVAGAAAIIAYAARPFGRPAVATVLVVATVGALSFFSIRSMVTVTFARGDVPHDLLVYTQSSPDIPDIMADIEALALATGKGYDLPIAIDSADSFAWPWAWYLRDYRAVNYSDFSNGVPTGDFAVILVAARNADKVNDRLAASGELYGSPIRYPHRWWFDETYKSAMRIEDQECSAQFGNCGPFRLATWKHIFANVLDGSWPKTWLLYIRDHHPGRSPGSVDAFAYFPANFDTETGTLSARPIEPAAPSVDADGNRQFGGYGLLPGQFIAPADIEADAEGNLYVIDSATRKLQKFDAEGNFLASVDIRVNAGDPNEASEPWGLAIGNDGTVYVADTFGWRVRSFTADLEPGSVTFGQAPEDVGPAADPGPFDLYGPRDIAIDAEGALWVTDTGFDRVNIYTPGGAHVRTIGAGEGSGVGQFDEPVGIEIAPDGTVFVADMFNARVVLLDARGEWLRDFPVDGWGGRDVSDKPYLEALPDGRLALSLPGRDEVRIYERDGTLVARVDGGSEAIETPYGIAPGPDGRLWVVEGGAGRVRLLPTVPAEE